MSNLRDSLIVVDAVGSPGLIHVAKSVCFQDSISFADSVGG